MLNLVFVYRGVGCGAGDRGHWGGRGGGGSMSNDNLKSAYISCNVSAAHLTPYRK